MKLSFNSKKLLSSKGVAITYLIVCSAYIIFSDRFLLFFFDGKISINALSEIQSYKGLFFVLSSSILIYFALRKRDKIVEKYTSTIKNNQRQYEDLFTNMSHGVIYATPEGIVSSVNQSALKILGITEKEMIGKSLFDNSWEPIGANGEPMSLKESPTKKAIKNKKPEHNILVGTKHQKEGYYIWLKVNAIPEFKNNETVPFRVCITIDDITPLKNYQQELEETQKKVKNSLIKTQFSEFLLKEASKMAKIGVYEIYPKSKDIYFSDELLKVFKLSKNEQQPLEKSKQLLTEKSKTILETAVKNCMESGVVMDEELELKVQDNHHYWVRVIIKPVYNDDEIVGRRGVVQDITAEKNIQLELLRAKEKAEVNEQKMKEAQKLANLGSWYYDVVNDVSEWSEETYNIWEIDKNKPVINAIDLKQIIHPNDWERFKAVRTKSFEKGIPYNMELQLLSANGDYKTVNTIGSPVFDKNNKVIAFEGTTQDISNRKVIENELRTAKEKAEKSQYTMAQTSKYAKIGYWDYDFTLNKLTWSDFIYQLYELTPEDDIPTYEEAKKNFDEPSRVKITTATKAFIENGTSYDIELKMVNSKREIWIRNFVQPVFNDAQEVVGKRGIIQDITEEKELRELNQRVGRLAKIGSWEVNLIEETIYWSKEVHLIHGTDPETYTPDLENAINFYREDYRALIESRVNDCITKGEPYELDAVIVNQNKQEIWVRTNADAEFINGVCTRIYGSFQNINSIKQTENKLISLAQNLPGLVYEYHIHPDGTDTLKNISGKVKETWGFTASEAINNIKLIWSQIEAGGEIEAFKTSIQKSIENKTKWQAQVKYVMPTTGKMHTHLGVGTPSFLADGTIVFNSITLDITQQAKNEELLEQTSRMARIGSWELDLLNQEEQKMYWSPIIKEILEIEDEHDASLIQVINFHVGESRERIQKAIELLINEGIEFDEEILLKTAKGNLCWCRAIGKSEVVNDKRVKIYGSYQDINDQKVAALELEKSLRSLKDYKYSLDQSAIIAFTDRKGIITSVNDNFCTTSGYSKQEVIGQTHQILNANYHSGSFFKEMWDEITAGKVWRGEIKNRTKQGNYYWVDTTIVPFLNEENKPTQYLSIRFDITERKRIEEEKNKFQETIENSLNEIYMFNKDNYKFTYANNGALFNLGYSLVELKEFSPINIKPDYTLETFNELVAPLKSGELEKIIFFTNHKRKNGSIYPVEVHLSLVKEAEKENFLAIVLDITERKGAEEMYRLLADNTNDLIMLYNIDSTLKYISPSVETLLGYTTNELIDTKFYDLIHKDDIRFVQESINNKVINNNNLNVLSFRIHHKDGHTIWLEKSVSPIYKKGEIVSLVAANRDITQWMLAKKEIEDYQTSLQKLTSEISMIEEKQKKEIAANIHDHLSQSLVISKMRIEDLQKTENLEHVQEDLTFIKNHISGALENSRKITYDLSPPVLYQLGLIDAIDWYVDESKDKYGIDFEFNTNVSSLQLTEFNSILLFRCIQEAFTNTIKYAEATAVTIDLTKDDDTITVEIVDNGNGFDTSKLNNSVSSSSGFGLFAVRERIRNMNGELDISSKINVGTKIKICVPL
jgi:PAS domain S-box-containing protein